MRKNYTMLILLSIILTSCNKPSNINTSTPSITSESSAVTSESFNSEVSEETSLSETPLSTSETPTSDITSDTTGDTTSDTTSDDTSLTEDNLPAEVKTYYQGVDLTQKGNDLKSELYDKIKGHTGYSYSSLAGIMKTTDRDWNLSPDKNDSNPYMVFIYGTYNFNASTAKKHNASMWDKEHIWAKSRGAFGKSTGAGSDLHHLRASDKYNNNGRSNFDFGRVDTLKKWVADDNGKGTNSGKVGFQNGFSGREVYEPMDIYKGDVARAIFYMATRYSVGSPTLSIVEEVSLPTSSPGKIGILSILLEWNKLDPVDEFEFNRNGLVQQYQKNRNPFIDYPYLADAIWA